MGTTKNKVTKKNPYFDKLYTKGFVGCIGEKPPKIHDNWHIITLDENIHIAYETTVKSYKAGNSFSFVFVIGHIISLDIDSVKHDEIVDYLYEQLKESENSFQNAIDKCSGRFICIYKIANNIYIINDATGNRAIYYCQIPKIAFSSHAEALALFMKKPLNEEVIDYLEEAKPRTYNVTYLPGFITKYQEINVLCPNTKLNLSNGKITRYYPRSGYTKKLSMEYVTDTAVYYLKDFAKKWGMAYNLSISLTAGIDSRLTLSAFKEHVDKIFFFTYIKTGEKKNSVDSLVAKKIVTDLGGNHRDIIFNYEDLKSKKDYRFFKKIMKHNVEFEHFFPLAYQYIKQYPSDRLHIRSNLGELLRGWYYYPPIKNKISENGSVLSNFVRLHKMRVKNADHILPYKCFEQYIEQTSIKNIENPLFLYNLLYWEQSLGMWQSSVLLESDISHDTVNIFNCRALLDLFLQAPSEDLLTGNCITMTIKKMWPELLEYPINPKYCDLLANDEYNNNINIHKIYTM